MSEARSWEAPKPAQPLRGEERAGAATDALTPEQVRSWRERGFALVDGLFPRELVDRVVQEAGAAFPEPGTPEAEGFRDFGSRGRFEFPAASDAANQMTLHPRLLRALAQLLGVSARELRLSQSDLWPKYGRAPEPDPEPGVPPEPGSVMPLDNQDQRIHVDYPNHTLTHPPAWEEPEAVEVIVYLSDVEQSGGATALVPRSGPDDPAYAWPIVNTPGVAGLDWINDRRSAERYLEQTQPEIAGFRRALYEREVGARYGVGSVLLYRHDTWHRGTPLEPGARRLAQNLTFHRAGAEWVTSPQRGWAWAMYRPEQTMERLIARASVEQRCVLGFPAPGHSYWTPETLAAVQARYGAHGIDLSEYESALSAG